MGKYIFKYLVFVLILFLSSSQISLAHQPRIVEDDSTEITNPEISQAFYGQLDGSDHVYHLRSDKPFDFYVGLLLPDHEDSNKQISAEIYQLIENRKVVLATLDGTTSNWTPFYEEFGQDNYLWGPEFKSPDSDRSTGLKGEPVDAGDYYIRVYSPDSQGKYSLVTGFLEEFPPSEIANSLIVIPALKFGFFGYSFLELIRSPYIFGPVLLLSLLGFTVYKLLKVNFTKKPKAKKRKQSHN